MNIIFLNNILEVRMSMKSPENPNSLCVHDLVVAYAAATPDAIAIVEGYKQLTYGELDTRANRLARLLCELGVGPETTSRALYEEVQRT